MSVVSVLVGLNQAQQVSVKYLGRGISPSRSSLLGNTTREQEDIQHAQHPPHELGTVLSRHECFLASQAYLRCRPGRSRQATHAFGGAMGVGAGTTGLVVMVLAAAVVIVGGG